MEWSGVEGTGVEWRGGEGRAGQGRVPDCLGGLSRVWISSRSTRPWNGQPPSTQHPNDTQHHICFHQVTYKQLMAGELELHYGKGLCKVENIQKFQ